MKNGKCQPIQVVDHAFDLLELLAFKKVPMSTKVLAERLGVSPQRANNLLRVLYRRGYVSQDRSRHYRLGPQFCIFGNTTAYWERLREVLEPVLINLNTQTGFGAFAGVLENDRLYCCAQILPTGEKGAQTQQFWTEELHSTASGRVLLAALSPEERKKLFARTTRRKMTQKTVLDPEELEKICRTTAKVGYAEVRDESWEGTSSIAIPVHDFSGSVIAAMSLYGASSVWEKTSSLQKKTILETAKQQVKWWPLKF